MFKIFLGEIDLKKKIHKSPVFFVNSWKACHFFLSLSVTFAVLHTSVCKEWEFPYKSQEPKLTEKIKRKHGSIYQTIQMMEISELLKYEANNDREKKK